MRAVYRPRRPGPVARRWVGTLPNVVVVGSQAEETDTANAGTVVVTVAGSLATETDTANAGTPAVVVAGNLATETDTANAGTPLIVVAGAQASETDTANSGTPALAFPGSQASETDTANAGTPTVAVAGSQAEETDTANAGTADTGTPTPATPAPTAGAVQPRRRPVRLRCRYRARITCVAILKPVLVGRATYRHTTRSRLHFTYRNTDRHQVTTHAQVTVTYANRATVPLPDVELVGMGYGTDRLDILDVELELAAMTSDRDRAVMERNAALLLR